MCARAAEMTVVTGHVFTLKSLPAGSEIIDKSQAEQEL